MAGRVRASALPYEDLNAFAFCAEHLAPSALPQSDGLRLRILGALMQRIKKFRPGDYPLCFGAIKAIATFEALPDYWASPEEKELEIRELLSAIASEPVSLAKHNKLGVKLQQEALRDLFTRDKYLDNCTLRSRMEWFTAHWDQLTAMVSLRKCRCKGYRSSFGEFKEAAYKRPTDLTTVRNATDFLLAFMHHLTAVSAENLRKALKTKA